MLRRWLIGREPVHVARGKSSREAIYRFRYRVFVEELAKDVQGADHDRKWINDPEDEEPGSMILFTGSIEKITGSARVQAFGSGEAPLSIRERYGLTDVPGIEDHAIGETSRLMIDPAKRGKLVLAALARIGFTYLCEKGVQFIFCQCAPGLVMAYKRLGYRPYAAPVLAGADGLRIPLVGVTSDTAHLRRVNSPLADIPPKYFGPGKLPPVDPATYQSILFGNTAPIEANTQEVWKQIQDELLAGGRAVLFDGLSESAIEALTTKGLVINVPLGKTITRAHLYERELFVILDGAFEVLVKGQRVALLCKGEVFGELAFLLDSGKRTATIRSVTQGKVFMLRRRFLDELLEEDPKLAARLLFNLGRIVSTRMAGLLGDAN